MLSIHGLLNEGSDEVSEKPSERALERVYRLLNHKTINFSTLRNYLDLEKYLPPIKSIKGDSDRYVDALKDVVIAAGLATVGALSYLNSKKPRVTKQKKITVKKTTEVKE